MKIPRMPNRYILNSFRSQYGYLKKFGLKIDDVVNLQMDIDVINVSHPLIFDNRLLPEKFMGLDVRSHVNDADIYKEFKVTDNQSEYIWAYQRFEEFVDKNAAEIKAKLGNEDLSKIEMLDALCFGGFEKHKLRCIESENSGKISVWKNKHFN